ncbi:MAG: GlsB/YeaQ/YmgE family stress response membrane protein [Nevskiales bacterium]
MLNGLWAVARCRQQGRARMSALSRWGGIAVMMLETKSIIVILLIGLVAGWLAGRIMGGGFGLIGDIIIGIIGAFIGNWLLGALGIFIGMGIIGAIISATIGAVVLLLVIKMIKQVV